MCVCVPVYGYVGISEHVLKGQKRALSALWWGSQAVVSYRNSIQGSECRSCKSVTPPPNPEPSLQTLDYVYG